jgi:hypothetical protein
VREFARLLAEFRPILKESIGDGLLCLDCGRKFKTLVRHLRQEHSLTPEQYRAKWDLPSDAPMKTPAHASMLVEKARNRGRKLLSEKRSAAHRGKKQAPESVEKRAAALRGRKQPPEAIAKGKATRAAKREARLAAAEQAAAA